MTQQQLHAPQKQKAQHKRLSWLFWTVLTLVILITIGLAILIFWLLKTQDLTKVSPLIGLIASIIAILTAPLILLFTITKPPPPPTNPIFSTQSHSSTPSPTPFSSQEHSSAPQEHSSIWNVPYFRNPFFTGRQNILTHLHNSLTTGKTAALTQPQAISGLGGIGKTQTAIEYAYRYHDEYHHVFWVRSEKREELISDFVTIADLLSLPEKDAQDQILTIAAVKRWLHTSTHWLLILDNADDLEMVRDFIPSKSQGHILLTTRAQAMGTLAQSVEIEKMEPEEGTLFLLHRAKILAAEAPLDQASAADSAKAEEIVHAMDGLPLALDQVGAYIEETRCSLSSYLDLYQKQRTQLHKQRGRLASSDHPLPVASTWSLSFNKVKKANPAAADLLRLSAFLAPDAIPEELITEGAPDLGRTLAPIATDPLKLNAAIRELLKYSLVRRNPDQTLTIHRLVQAVLKDEMNKRTQCLWAKRTVRAVNRVFPYVEYETWPLCRRYISHAQVCAELIEQWDMAFREAGRLLNQAGYYLNEHAHYGEAELLYQRSLAIREKVLGHQHPAVVQSLNNLASLYYFQGKYVEAEPLSQRSLAICEKTLGTEHPYVVQSLNTLAGLYYFQGKYAEAEPLSQQSLAVCEKTLGAEHPYMASSLNNLAVLYCAQGKYTEAEPLYQQGLAIGEKVLGHEHPYVAESLNNLALLYYFQGKYAEAEPLSQQSLAIGEKTLGAEHPNVASSLNNLALLYKTQGKYEEAEPLFQRALKIWEKVLEDEHPALAISLNNLATLYKTQGKYAEAEPLFQRALAVSEKRLGPEHPTVAVRLNNLALLYKTQGKYEEAESLFQRALAIWEKTLGSEHPHVATGLENYAALLRKTKREDEAEKLEARAKEIRTKHAQANTTKSE